MALDNESDIEGMQNYTLELQAQKTGGAEGFLISFGVKGDSLYWWNMGGWGNTQSCVEKGTLGGRSIIGDSKPMNLATNKWYKIKIEVKGETYKCYLDGKLMHEFTDVKNFDPLYAHVGRTKDGKVIIKIVNVTNEAQDVKIDLKNAPSLSSTAKVTVLTGGADDENSFRTPKQVAPKEETFSGVSSSFTYPAKPCSLTILEIDAK
jgi:alpha-L-arabinofuranosidase